MIRDVGGKQVVVALALDLEGNTRVGKISGSLDQGETSSLIHPIREFKSGVHP